MSTLQALDADLAAAIEAGTSLSQRMRSDYLPESGETVHPGEARYRLRVDALRREDYNANDQGYVASCQIDAIYGMTRPTGEPMDERASMAQVHADQQALVSHSFWRALASVYDLEPDTAPTVSDSTEREGHVLRFQVVAVTRLNP